MSQPMQELRARRSGSEPAIDVDDEVDRTSVVVEDFGTEIEGSPGVDALEFEFEGGATVGRLVLGHHIR